MDYLPNLFFGALVTLAVAVMAIAIGSVFGLLGSIARLSHSTIARAISGCYITVIRGTPDLIIILVIYFGGTVERTAGTPRTRSSAAHPASTSMAAQAQRARIRRPTSMDASPVPTMPQRRAGGR